MGAETVLVTGASSGIGLELARCFAAEGCRLVLVARKGIVLESLATELRKGHKIQAQIITADLAQPETPNRLLAHLQAAGLKVDVLVNNAAFGAQGRFAELPLEVKNRISHRAKALQKAWAVLSRHLREQAQ